MPYERNTGKYAGYHAHHQPRSRVACPPETERIRGRLVVDIPPKPTGISASIRGNQQKINIQNWFARSKAVVQQPRTHRSSLGCNIPRMPQTSHIRDRKAFRKHVLYGRLGESSW
jgi:hypothetical protein